VLFTADALFRCQASRCNICGGQSGTVTGLTLRVLRFYSVSFIPPMLHNRHLRVYFTRRTKRVSWKPYRNLLEIGRHCMETYFHFFRAIGAVAQINIAINRINMLINTVASNHAIWNEVNSRNVFCLKYTPTIDNVHHRSTYENSLTVFVFFTDIRRECPSKTNSISLQIILAMGPLRVKTAGE
jgi:hypothetical protein